ncbi:macoilin [Zerene cesonia]|uniref:macoilin n=1 Tax=Zerene cesonia TaxID=33412 RepID=UPI0018E548BF|nr:macoilin [Zerene cesonia]
MKRRNAESGKMRRPLKRTKIPEGMYGNSITYVKFIMSWAIIVVADYMLEFRFEFLYPFWILLRALYDSFKFQGLAFTIIFLCMALTSDMIFFFVIPLQYIYFLAGTYVWVQYVWNIFGERGVCVPTVALCCLIIYTEGALRGRGSPPDVWRPLAAHCIGYPAMTFGFGVKSYVSQRLRQRRQRQVRAENEFYFQLLRDALPESALEQNQQGSKEERVPNGGNAGVGVAGGGGGTAGAGGEFAMGEARLNGSVRRRCRDHNGWHEHAQLHVKLDKLEKHLASRDREKAAQNGSAHTHAHAAHTPTPLHAHAHTNGCARGAGAPDEERHDTKGSTKTKCEKKEASTVREERRKNKNRDKDKESVDSHKSTEQSKEHIVKEKELEINTKECQKSNRDSSSNKEKEKENKEREKENREREREKEKEREKERERERERENKEREKERERREREEKLARECSEELKRVRAELSAARSGEAEARRALAAAAAAERQRRADHAQLKHAHAQLQHKVSAWRSTERAAQERRLSEERRAQAQCKHSNGECESTWCRSRLSAQEAEAAALRRELQRARDRAERLQRDLAHAADQVRSLEARQEEAEAAGAAGAAAAAAAQAHAWQALQERAAHLERSLSAETRVKLDLLSALGDAKRHMHIQEGLISRQEKEIEELKAQMLAVMPTEFVTPVSGTVSKLRLSDGSPLDPNASVYTPKQLCSDA